MRRISPTARSYAAARTSCLERSCSNSTRSPVARNGSETISPVTVESAATISPSDSATSNGPRGIARSTSSASRRTVVGLRRAEGVDRDLVPAADLQRERRRDSLAHPRYRRRRETSSIRESRPPRTAPIPTSTMKRTTATAMAAVSSRRYYQHKSRYSWQPLQNLIIGSASRCGIWLRSRRSLVTGSFGRAATELGYTQSAISQQIAALERIVGEKLVERPGGPRAISITEAGELLLRHAEAIVGQARRRASRHGLAARRRDRFAPGRHLPERRRPRAARSDAPLPDRLARDRARAVRAVDRPRAVQRGRERRPRPRLLQPPGPRRPLRGARADERPLRPDGPRRSSARRRPVCIALGARRLSP